MFCLGDTYKSAQQKPQTMDANSHTHATAATLHHNGSLWSLLDNPWCMILFYPAQKKGFVFKVEITKQNRTFGKHEALLYFTSFIVSLYFPLYLPSLLSPSPSPFYVLHFFWITPLSLCIQRPLFFPGLSLYLTLHTHTFRRSLLYSKNSSLYSNYVL